MVKYISHLGRNVSFRTSGFVEFSALDLRSRAENTTNPSVLNETFYRPRVILYNTSAHHSRRTTQQPRTLQSDKQSHIIYLTSWHVIYTFKPMHFGQSPKKKALVYSAYRIGLSEMQHDKISTFSRAAMAITWTSWNEEVVSYRQWRPCSLCFVPAFYGLHLRNGDVTHLCQVMALPWSPFCMILVQSRCQRHFLRLMWCW